MVSQEERARIVADVCKRRCLTGDVNFVAGAFGATFTGFIVHLLASNLTGALILLCISSVLAVLGIIAIVRLRRVKDPALQMMDAIERQWEKEQ